MTKYNQLGLLAATINITATFPLVYYSTVNKDTKSFSYMWLILSLIAQMLWLIYGTINCAIPVITLATFLACVYIYLIVLKTYIERIERRKKGKNGKREDKLCRKIQ